VVVTLGGSRDDVAGVTKRLNCGVIGLLSTEGLVGEVEARAFDLE